MKKQKQIQTRTNFSYKFSGAAMIAPVPTIRTSAIEEDALVIEGISDLGGKEYWHKFYLGGEKEVRELITVLEYWLSLK